MAFGQLSRIRWSSSIPAIVAINVTVFGFWFIAGQTLTQNSQLVFLVNNFLISWSSVTEGRYWTLLTSVFSHNQFWHILLNMFVLVNFGLLVEQILGVKKFLAFYLIAGIISSICHAAVSAFILGAPGLPALGASGAISGLILIFALLFPRERIWVLAIFPVPALWGAVAFIGLDVWGLIAQAGGSGLPIGHGAHIGGALTGIAYYFLIHRRKPRAFY